MKVRNVCICILGFVVLAMPLLAANAQTVVPDERAGYSGTLRVYVSEPNSRYVNTNGSVAYHHGFLNYAIDRPINVGANTRYETSQVWNSVTNGFGTISQSNIEAVAVVFVDTFVVADGAPPEGYWFNAYYADGCASAAAGSVGQNATTSGYTHTVFVEEGTATWCSACPSLINWLHNLQGTGLNFRYVALVHDKNNVAKNRLDNEFNTGYFPTTFMDGGSRVTVGSISQDSTKWYIDRAGWRTVTPLNVMVATKWTAANTIEVTIAIGNGVPANNSPDIPAVQSGTDSSYPGEVCSFTALGTDPDAHGLYYKWKFGDGDSTLWLGPFAAGVGSTTTHSYDEYDDYEVTVQTKDVFDVVSSWSPVHAVKIKNPSCCICTSTGNVDDSPDCLITMGDLTVLIDHLFITLTPLTCDVAGNVDQSLDGLITMGDLTVLIDHLFITLSPLPPCY